jgi:hypothetical protein
MTIQNGQVANADEINRYFGRIAQATIQPIFDRTATGYNFKVQGGSPIYNNLFISRYGDPVGVVNYAGSADLIGSNTSNPNNTTWIFNDIAQNYFFSPISGTGPNALVSIDEFNLAPGLNGSVWVAGGSTLPAVTSGTDGYVNLTRASNGDTWLQGTQDIGSPYNSCVVFNVSTNNANNQGCYIMGLGNRATALMFNYGTVSQTNTICYIVISGNNAYGRTIIWALKHKFLVLAVNILCQM